MSFDARSRERLEALGRTLPQKLPLPQAPNSPSPAARKADTATRHRVEIEENPQDLFRALMQASADGTVPPHLLERLRDLEAAQPSRRSGSNPSAGPGAVSPFGVAETGSSGRPAANAPRRPAANRNAPPPRRASGPERDLYDAFDDLLHLENDLEHEDGPKAPVQSERATNDRLLPKPTLRQPPPGSDRP
jgi:hypothetical protein